MLAKYEIGVSKDEVELVDTLRYAWRNLQSLAIDVQSSLSKIQPDFKNDLFDKVEKFKVDTISFVNDYEEVHDSKKHCEGDM